MSNRDDQRSLQTTYRVYFEDLRAVLTALLEKHHLHLAHVERVQGGLSSGAKCNPWRH